MTMLMVKACAGQSAPLIIDRHNFGVTLIKRGELQVATASANLLFHYQLPPRVPMTEERINCSMLTAPGHSLLCQSILPLLQTMHNLESKAFVGSFERCLRCII